MMVRHPGRPGPGSSYTRHYPAAVQRVGFTHSEQTPGPLRSASVLVRRESLRIDLTDAAIDDRVGTRRQVFRSAHGVLAVRPLHLNVGEENSEFGRSFNVTISCPSAPSPLRPFAHTGRIRTAHKFFQMMLCPAMAIYEIVIHTVHRFCTGQRPYRKIAAASANTSP
jgi:hypothetical protein